MSVEKVVKNKQPNNNLRRLIRFNKGSAINIPGISDATTNMKLVYRFPPDICVAIKPQSIIIDNSSIEGREFSIFLSMTGMLRIFSTMSHSGALKPIKK